MNHNANVQMFCRLFYVEKIIEKRVNKNDRNFIRYEGEFKVSNHNEHNGYYGGFSIRSRLIEKKH